MVPGKKGLAFVEFSDEMSSGTALQVRAHSFVRSSRPATLRPVPTTTSPIGHARLVVVAPVFDSRHAFTSSAVRGESSGKSPSPRTPAKRRALATPSRRSSRRRARASARRARGFGAHFRFRFGFGFPGLEQLQADPRGHAQALVRQEMTTRGHRRVSSPRPRGGCDRGRVGAAVQRPGARDRDCERVTGRTDGRREGARGGGRPSLELDGVAGSTPRPRTRHGARTRAARRRAVARPARAGAAAWWELLPRPASFVRRECAAGGHRTIAWAGMGRRSGCLARTAAAIWIGLCDVVR